MKILGREYTLWIAFFAGLLNFLVGFKLPGLSVEQAAWIIAAVNAIAAAIAAWRTRPIAPQLWTYAATTVFGLLAAYGFNFTQEQISGFQLLLLAGLALWTRGQVSPSEDAHRTGVLGNRPLM